MHGFPYKMLEDHTTIVSESYNLLGEDGKAGRGTFIIDPDGVIRGIEVTS
jgi:peroxiredoxin (alkyl hydroperoxide reductase subunit C)